LFYLERLTLEGFRNYRYQQVHFHPALNVITGNNAQGKTNLLESIFFLSVNRSFRTRKDHELAYFDGHCFNLKGNFIKEGFNHAVQVEYRSNKRLMMKVNNDHFNRYAQIQNYPVIVFSPDDLQMISAGPSVRRRFLNLEASRLDSLYLKELKDYQRVLNQRNQVLKNYLPRARLEDTLSPWDQSLVELGVSLIRARVAMIKALEIEAGHFFSEMTEEKEKLSLEYASTVPYCGDREEMKELFYRDLLNKRDQELRRCSTLLGPHLDDLVVSINGYNTRPYASQGQKRTAALALKMGEVSLFHHKNDLCPIILLDDVFSEFDLSRKQQLLDFLNKSGGQCFITSAVDLQGMVEKLNRTYKHIVINQGCIRDETVRTGD